MSNRSGSSRFYGFMPFDIQPSGCLFRPTSRLTAVYYHSFGFCFDLERRTTLVIHIQEAAQVVQGRKAGLIAELEDIAI